VVAAREGDLEGEFEVEKVDDVALAKALPEGGRFEGREIETLEDAVGEVAKDARDQKESGGGATFANEAARFPVVGDEDERNDGDKEEDDGGPRRAVPEAKSDTLVVDADEIEETFNDSDVVRVVHIARCWPAEHNPPFRDLIKDVERKDDKGEKFPEAGF